MADGHSNTLPKPAKRSKRWTSFVGALLQGGSFEVFRKKTIPLIVYGLNTTNIRF